MEPGKKHLETKMVKLTTLEWFADHMVYLSIPYAVIAPDSTPKWSCQF